MPCRMLPSLPEVLRCMATAAVNRSPPPHPSPSPPPPDAAAGACKALLPQALRSPGALRALSREECARLLRSAGYDTYGKPGLGHAIGHADSLVVSDTELQRTCFTCVAPQLDCSGA